MNIDAQFSVRTKRLALVHTMGTLWIDLWAVECCIVTRLQKMGEALYF